MWAWCVLWEKTLRRAGRRPVLRSITLPLVVPAADGVFTRFMPIRRWGRDRFLWSRDGEAGDPSKYGLEGVQMRGALAAVFAGAQGVDPKSGCEDQIDEIVSPPPSRLVRAGGAIVEAGISHVQRMKATAGAD